MCTFTDALSSVLRDTDGSVLRILFVQAVCAYCSVLLFPSSDPMLFSKSVVAIALSLSDSVYIFLS